MILTYDINNQVNLDQALKVWNNLMLSRRKKPTDFPFGNFVELFNDLKGYHKKEIMKQILGRMIDRMKFPQKYKT